MRDAFLWLAVDSTIGGLLVTGTRGTAKSTAARGLTDVLPPIDVVPGDPCNRAPSAGETGVPRATPFVELPIGATEDRVVGTLDVRALLTESDRRFEPGLLARANRGVLYVDEVNLLPDHLVDVLLDAAATGVNVVEREGASYVHDARIVLIGTMNPEEGELRPQLLDRFGLCVPVAGDGDLARRVTIVERRLAFENDPAAFVLAHAAQTDALRGRVAAARERLPHVAYGTDTIALAAQLALAANVEGMRADLTIVRTARAIAALAGRPRVSDDDVARAAVAALAHRRREAPPMDRTPPPPQAPPPSAPSSPPQGNQPRDGGDAEREAASAPTAEPPARIVVIGTPATVPLATGPRRNAAQSPGTAAARGRDRDMALTPNGRARIVVTATSTVALLATVRAAAADQTRVHARHLRYIERRGRARRLIVLLVDASGSMAAAARMRAAKGVLCGLLEDAYRRRDAVALIAFRGTSAQTLVPPTRSAALAYRRLRTLPAGGRTPLADGLRAAGDLIATNARRDPHARAHLVLISDARANVPARDPFPAALREAARLRARDVRMLCIDTESGRIRLGRTAQLATALDADYRTIESCTERVLGATVREWMATA